MKRSKYCKFCLLRAWHNPEIHAEQMKLARLENARKKRELSRRIRNTNKQFNPRDVAILGGDPSL